MDDGEAAAAINDINNMERFEKIKEIIVRQFDVELLHKWREVRILEEELDRGSQLKEMLEKLVLNDQIYGQQNDRSASFAYSQPPSRLSTPLGVGGGADSPPGVVVGVGGVSKKQRQASVTAMARNEGLLQGERPSSGSTSEPMVLYEQCPDGSIVRLRCPRCKAEKFRSILGMVNHCRINCGLFVSNPDERIQQCGIPVSPDEVPPDYFLTKNASQMKRERELAQIRAGVQAPIIDLERKPMIREFSETDTQCIAPTLSTGEGGGKRRLVIGLPASIASQQENVEALESRFYIRKRVIIGNYARRLDNNFSEAEAAQREIPTHEWRLFVKPFDASDDMEGYVKEVRFTLHPSYRPNDVIVVEGRPFEIRMSGWGEFPARIEIIFKERKNKPAQFVHHLRLWSCHSRVFSLMSEQAYDIDLDRKAMTTTGNNTSGSSNGNKGERVKSGPMTVDDALAINSRQFPLFGSLPKTSGAVAGGGHGNASTSTSIPHYNRAVSYAEFIKLPSFDQIVLERERALALQRHLLPSFPSLSLEYVIEWCRRNGLSPSSGLVGKEDEPGDGAAAGGEDEESAGTGVTLDVIKGLQFCRYCGLAHFPQERFEVLQKNCSMRPRKLHLSSRTTATEMMANLTISPEPLTEPKRPRVIETVFPHADALSLKQQQQDLWTPEETWINDTLLPLELPAYRPRQQVCQVLSKALRSFLSDLLRKSQSQLPDTIERAVGRPAILTPLHLYQAITGTIPVSAIASKDNHHQQQQQQQSQESSEGTAKEASSKDNPNNRFDFLSNAYMAGT